MTAVPGRTKSQCDDDYEDPEPRMVDTWPSAEMLPARPMKEREYADKHYFKGALDPPTRVLAVPSSFAVGQTRGRWMRLEDVDKPIHKDTRGQQSKGNRSTNRNKTPLPPPRPPTTLLKKYQPLPPTPWEDSTPALQRHTFPEAQRGHSQEQGEKGGPGEGMGQGMHLFQDVQHNEWYIGEHSRQVVEEALMQENKDGTFLVRDCSTKSKAEPYVLVVFYGNKVYNVKIRFLERSHKFALGTGLRGDEKFDSVEDIIEHYKYFPIILIDGKDKTGVSREECYLTQPLPLSRRMAP
ncbi:cytokine-dependent hematopoietic cell linker [Ctenodactylus gundi]